jgi:hypothetical protein
MSDATIYGSAGSTCSSPLLEEVPDLVNEDWSDEDRAIIEYLLMGNTNISEIKEVRRNIKSSITPKQRKLTPAERRAKHREVVRRSYHRNKETLTNLRNTVEKLEAHFRALHMGKKGKQLSINSKSNTDIIHDIRQKTTMLDEEHDVLQKESIRLQNLIREHTQYAEVIKQVMESEAFADEEEEEAESMKKNLVSSNIPPQNNNKIKFAVEPPQQTTQVTSSFSSSSSSPTPIPTESMEGRKKIGFTSLSENEAGDLVQFAYQEILQFSLNGRALSTGGRVMGWEDRRLVDGTSIKFSLRKTFQDHAAYDFLTKTWMCFSDPDCVEKKFKGAIKLYVLQRINPDTLVILRDVTDPVEEKIFRCAYLLFRVRTIRGFIICVRSLDSLKDTCQFEKTIQWVDMFTWFVFNRQGVLEDSIYHETAAEVEYGGRVNYGSDTQLSGLAIEVLNTALRWESFMVAPVFKLSF